MSIEIKLWKFYFCFSLLDKAWNIPLRTWLNLYIKWETIEEHNRFSYNSLPILCIGGVLNDKFKMFIIKLFGKSFHWKLK